MHPLTLILAFALTYLPASSYALTTKSEVMSYGQDSVAIGYARKPKQSDIHYTEAYLDDPFNDTIRASYWSGDKQLIAFKQLTFKANTDQPTYYEFVDYRRAKGYKVIINAAGAAKVETIRLLANGQKKIIRVQDLAVDSNTVIDAGFHRYIVAHWDKLQQGKSVKMNFLQVDKARLVPLKIKKKKCDIPDTACFKVSLDNFLLQGVLPSIRLQYNSNTKQLLSYSGLGPVTQLSGKGQSVTILYKYL